MNPSIQRQKMAKISESIFQSILILIMIVMVVLSFLGVIFILEIIDGDNRVSQSYDAGWHEGINSCSEYWNLSSNEQYLINMYRINKLNNSSR